jgi:hypothetical protein
LLIPIYAFLIVHTGIYIITWTMVRYRIPMDALLLIFAGYSIHLLSEQFIKYLPANWRTKQA